MMNSLDYLANKYSLVSVIIERRFYRFLFFGVVNTAVTFGIYVLLKTMLGYQLSYFFSYISGIFISYLFNAVFVFKIRISISTFLRFPLAYAVQYVASAALLELLVNVFNLSILYSPLLVIAIITPLTYILNRFIFTKY
jgi:putative flippase GtrA